MSFHTAAIEQGRWQPQIAERFILSSSVVGPPNRTRDEETVRHSSRTHRGTCCPFMELLMGFAYAQLPYAALPTLVGTVGGLL